MRARARPANPAPEPPMTAAIFQLDTLSSLPLWAQVLIASRLARRATLWLPEQTPQDSRNALIARCDILDRCARVGEGGRGELEALAKDTPRVHRLAYEAAEAVHHAASAAFAAQSSQDFGAAEPSVPAGLHNAMVHASRSHGLSALQVRIFAAADMDLLRFACAEAGIGRYDGLKDAVHRLAPVHPPDRPVSIREPEDESGGAR